MPDLSGIRTVAGDGDPASLTLLSSYHQT